MTKGAFCKNLFFLLIGYGFVSGQEHTFHMNCETVVGQKTAGSNDAESSVGCGDNEVLVSCGFRTDSNINDPNSDGAFIQNDRCVARNGHFNTDGIYPVARCCPAFYFNQCQDVRSPESGDQNDDTTTATCPAGFILTGCSASTAWHNIDGVRPISGNSCQAQRSNQDFGNNHGVIASARCCQIKQQYQITCSIKTGPISGLALGDVSTINCNENDGEALFSCSGSGSYESLGGYFTDNNDPVNRCKAINAAAHSSSGAHQGITASAICCTVASTSSPTKATISPTKKPSLNPTFSPTTRLRECLDDCTDDCSVSTDGQSHCNDFCHDEFPPGAKVNVGLFDRMSRIKNNISENWVFWVGFFVLFGLSVLGNVILVYRLRQKGNVKYTQLSGFSHDDATQTTTDIN